MALNRSSFSRGRLAGHLSGSDRATRCSTGKIPAARTCVVSRPRRARTVNQRLGPHGRPIQVHFLDNWNYSPLTPFAAARTTRRAVVTSEADQYRQLARDFHLIARNLPLGEERSTFLKMAEEYDRLADQQERQTASTGDGRHVRKSPRRPVS